MATATERLLVRIDATTEQLRRELREADNALGRTSSNVDRQLRKIDRRFMEMKRSIAGSLAGVFSGFAIAKFSKDVLAATDTMKNLRGQLTLVTGSQEELNQVYTRTLQVANQTGASVETTANLYARLARSTEELNLSQDNLIGLTKTINQAFAVSGATAQEASASITQLSQGLAAGALRGEEFNSVNEQAPRIMTALADSLGKTRGELREMAKAGELTTDVVVRALSDGAAEIDREYQKLPVTIGRSMQELRNTFLDVFGSVDTGPLVDSIQQMTKALSDPATIEGLRSLAAGVVNLSVAAVQAASGFAKLGTSIGESIAEAVTGSAAGGGSIEALVKRFNELNEEIDFYFKNGQENSIGMDQLAEKMTNLKTIIEASGDRLVEVNGQWVIQKKTIESVDQAVSDSTESNKKLSGVLKEVTTSSKKLTKEKLEALGVYVKQRKEISAYIKSLEFELELTKLSGVDKEIAIALRREAAGATAEESAEIENLVRVLHDAKIAEEALAEVTVKAERVQKKNIEAMAEAAMAADRLKEANREMQVAIDRGIERLDDSFANIFKDILKTGKITFDSLKDTALDALAEIIYAFARNKIMLSVGGIGGGLSSAAAASGGGLFSGGISGFPGSALTGLEGFFANKGFTGTANFLYGAQTGLAETGALIGGGVGAGSLLTGGAGLVGGLLGNQLFGATSGIGSSLGGIGGGLAGASLLGGAFGGPIGAAVGGLLGSGLESLFAGKPSDKRQRTTIDPITGSMSFGGFSGDKFSQKNQDASRAIAESLAQIANALGVTEQITAQVGGRTGFRFRIGGDPSRQVDTQEFDSADDLLASAVSQFIEMSDKFSDATKKLVKQFDGTIDETLKYGQALSILDELLRNNPIQKAIDDFTVTQETAAGGLMSVYNEQIRVIDELADSFDGSLDSATALSGAMAQNKELAYQLAVSLQEVNASIQNTVRDQIRYFKEQTFNDNELLKDLENQFAFFFKGLPMQTDPAKIAEIGEYLTSLNQRIFDMGSPELQRSNVDVFIQTAREIRSAVESATSAALEGLSQSQDDLNERVQSQMEIAADSLSQSAAINLQAANTFSEAVNTFVNSNRFNPNGLMA